MDNCICGRQPKFSVNNRSGKESYRLGCRNVDCEKFALLTLPQDTPEQAESDWNQLVESWKKQQ